MNSPIQSAIARILGMCVFVRGEGGKKRGAKGATRGLFYCEDHARARPLSLSLSLCTYTHETNAYVVRLRSIGPIWAFVRLIETSNVIKTDVRANIRFVEEKYKRYQTPARACSCCDLYTVNSVIFPARTGINVDLPGRYIRIAPLDRETKDRYKNIIYNACILLQEPLRAATRLNNFKLLHISF